MFPPVNSNKDYDSEFNSFEFWRESVPLVIDDNLVNNIIKNDVKDKKKDNKKNEV